MGLEKKERGNYLSIVGGSIRQSVPENTEGAIKREYETSDKKKGVKWELVYDSLSGVITDIYFRDGDFGKQLYIKITDNDKDYTLQLNTNSSYAEDLMRKLPNVKLENIVEFIPYDFEDDNGKKRQGITVRQGESKIDNFFVEKTEEGKYKNVNGIPEPEGDTELMDKDDWKMHFMKVRKFLVAYTTENVSSKLQDKPEKVEYPDDEISPENIPF